VNKNSTLKCAVLQDTQRFLDSASNLKAKLGERYSSQNMVDT